MKIMLINGAFVAQQINEPAPILALSAYLKKNSDHEVVVYDRFMFPQNTNHVENIINQQADYIGLSSFSFESKEYVLKLIKELRNQGQKCFICVGGHDASLNWKEYLEECPEMDAIIIGEGELTLLELVNKLQKGEDVYNIKGIAYIDKANGKFVMNEARELINLDELPFMDRTVLTKLLSLYGDKVVNQATMLSGRGCHGGCSFCSVRAYGKLQNNKYFKVRAVKNIIDEMEYVYRTTGMRSFSFADDTFIVPGKGKLERLKEFNRGVKELPFEIGELKIVTRVDDLDEEVIELLKDTGVNKIYMGIESFDDNDLKFYKKGITLGKIEPVLDNLIKHGYGFEVDSERKLAPGFIIFNPYTTAESLMTNVRYFKKYKIPAKRLRRKLLIYRHTELFDRFSQNGLIDENGNYEYLNPAVDLVHKYFEMGLSKGGKIREPIRFIERLSHEFAINLDSSLIKVRRIIDSEWYELFEQLVRALEDGSISQVVVDKWYSNLLEKFDINKIITLTKIEEERILNEINSKHDLHEDFMTLFKLIEF